MGTNEKSEELQNRLIKLSLNTILFTKQLPKTTENFIMIKQIIRSATSIGANYTEAVYSYSRPEFIHSVNISKKEAAETLYWLSLLESINPNLRNQIQRLEDETQSILKIFTATVKTSQKNNKL